ncbi:MAG: NAD(P)H-dependent oxidoreductase [Deferribacterales bacterium]
MKNVLVVLGHSNYANSLSNKTIIDTIKDAPNVTVRNLDDVSENYVFDVEAEQKAMEAADVIVLQFPFHWYAVPSIMKKWFDDTLLYGWAYGEGGDKLAGKKLVISFTTGAPETAYVAGAGKGHTAREFLAPITASAALCNLDLAEIIGSYGMMYIPGFAGDKDEVTAKAKLHAEKLVRLFESL